jgi:hypothetical protein
MELIIAATAFFAIISPFINAWINRVNWSPKTKALVAWVTAIVFGTVYVLFTGGIANIYQLFIAAPVIYGYTQAVYQFLVKNIATKFEAITSKDSVVITPSAEAGKVDVTSDASIKETGDNVAVTPPVQVTPATPAEPVTIIPDPNVVG